MAVMKSQADENTQCVCKKSIADKPRDKWIQCGVEGCSSPWWHVSCAGLENIPDLAVKKLNYRCPKCGLADVGIKCIETTTYTKGISYEISKCLPHIVQAVVHKTTEAVNKSFAEVVKEGSETFLKETVKTTSQKAVQFMHDKEMREKNVVIFNVDEPVKETKEECVKMKSFSLVFATK